MLTKDWGNKLHEEEEKEKEGRGGMDKVLK